MAALEASVKAAVEARESTEPTPVGAAKSEVGQGAWPPPDEAPRRGRGSATPARRRKSA